jgi:hypothetical protein
MLDIDPRVLLFGTCYIDSEARVQLTKQWAELMLRLNADCNIWLIDSASPMRPQLDPRINVFDFKNNVGHLSRPMVTPGRDGWGRAFCKGLELASAHDYAVHIEADSLFRLPVMPICKQMRERGIKVASIPVNSANRVLERWVETGLMFFEVGWLKASDFVAQYNWPMRRARPTPEVIINALVRHDLKLMPWKGIRQDKFPGVGHANIKEGGYDWITHFHNDGLAYDRFVETVA